MLPPSIYIPINTTEICMDTLNIDTQGVYLLCGDYNAHNTAWDTIVKHDNIGNYIAKRNKTIYPILRKILNTCGTTIKYCLSVLLTLVCSLPRTYLRLCLITYFPVLKPTYYTII